MHVPLGIRRRTAVPRRLASVERRRLAPVVSGRAAPADARAASYAVGASAPGAPPPAPRSVAEQLLEQPADRAAAADRARQELQVGDSSSSSVVELAERRRRIPPGLVPRDGSSRRRRRAITWRRAQRAERFRCRRERFAARGDRQRGRRRIGARRQRPCRSGPASNPGAAWLAPRARGVLRRRGSAARGRATPDAPDDLRIEAARREQRRLYPDTLQLHPRCGTGVDEDGRSVGPRRSPASPAATSTGRPAIADANQPEPFGPLGCRRVHHALNGVLGAEASCKPTTGCESSSTKSRT